MSIPTQKTSSLKIAAAWSLVAIPLGWGVYQSVVKSLPLFQAAAPATAKEKEQGGRPQYQSPRAAQ